MKVRKGGGEEIPLVQGKGQRLRFAGAAVKRYPTPKARETIAGRKINNLRYADDTIFMAQREEELIRLDESERGE